LSAGAAVQISLLNNRGLQAAYNALGIAEVEMGEASLPRASKSERAIWISQCFGRGRSGS